MHNRYEQPIRKRVPEISALTPSDRPIVKGCEHFHLMQLAAVMPISHTMSSNRRRSLLPDGRVAGPVCVMVCQVTEHRNGA